MASTTTEIIKWLSIIRYLSASAGLSISILGITGNILNIIIFMSLQTFSQNSCAFCLFILSIVDSGFLLFNTLPTSFLFIFNGLEGVNSMLACKIVGSGAQIFGLMSHIVVCLAAIDQAISTAMLDRHQGINMKIMRYLIIIGIFFSVLNGIPFLMFYNPQPVQVINGTICRMTDNNGSFSKYVRYFSLPVTDGFLPITIMIIFGLTALRNVRNMRNKNVHIIRLRLERQLTKMVLMKILSITITVIPFLIAYLIRYNTSAASSDELFQTKILLIHRIFGLLLYLNYAVSVENSPLIVLISLFH